jgi:hypothetical protein
MTLIILQAPVDKATQLRVHKFAKSNNIPIRVFCAMLIKQGLDDIANGKLHIVQPSIATKKAKLN